MNGEMVIPKKRKLDKNQIRERISGYILMAPAAILLFVFTVYPIGFLFYRSLCCVAEREQKPEAE